MFDALSDDELNYINEHRFEAKFKAGETIFKIVVRDPTGRGLPGVEVLVAPEGSGDTEGFHQPGTVLFRSFTDTSGRCLFYRMNAEARYRIRAKAKAFS